VRDELGVGEARIAGVLDLGAGDHGDAVPSGIAMRPDGHQLPCQCDQLGVAVDAGERHQASLTKLRRDARLPAGVADVGVLAWNVPIGSPAVGSWYCKGGWRLVAMASDNLSRQSAGESCVPVLGSRQEPRL
jgi:hypothetical protein